MKNAIIGVIVVYVLLIAAAVFLLFTSLGKLGEGMADVQRCERVTGLGFWECADKTQAELDAIGTTTPQ